MDHAVVVHVTVLTLLAVNQTVRRHWTEARLELLLDEFVPTAQKQTASITAQGRKGRGPVIHRL